MIPLFPLKLVVFPTEKLNLHIFEPRYRALIHDVHRNKIPFGIPSYIYENEILYGTEVQLLAIEKEYPDGRMDIKTKGVRTFRIQEFQPQMNQKLYPGGIVTYNQDISSGDPTLKSSVLTQVSKMYTLMDIKKKLPQSSDLHISYPIAHHIGLTLDQEYALLKIEVENDRLEFIDQHLKQLLPVVKRMDDLQQKIRMNGHFKNVIPPNV